MLCSAHCPTAAALWECPRECLEIKTSQEGEVVDASSLAVLKARLGKALSNLVYEEVSLPVEGGGGTRWSLRSIPTP